MYRDHVSISTLRRLLVVQVLLLLCAPAAWSQQEFGDHIYGGAVSCKEYGPYDVHGSVMRGYYIHDMVTAPRCGSTGPATAKSAASVGPPALTSKTTAAKSTLAEASTENNSFDTALLTPPTGWNGSVPVTLESSYTFSVQGASATSPASFVIHWYIDGVLKKSEKVDEDGHGAPKFGFDFDVLPNDSGGYEFLVKMDGGSSATGFVGSGSSSKFNTSFINFVLPQGWTCTWLSNGAGCDAPR